MGERLPDSNTLSIPKGNIFERAQAAPVKARYGKAGLGEWSWLLPQPDSRGEVKE